MSNKFLSQSSGDVGVLVHNTAPIPVEDAVGGSALGSIDDTLMDMDLTLTSMDTALAGTLDVNLSDVNGLSVAAGAGATSGGTQRVVVATNDPNLSKISKWDPDYVPQRQAGTHVALKGYREAIPTSYTGLSVVYNDGEVHPIAADNYGFRISSSHPSDSPAGSGLREVRVVWMDSTWTRQSSDVDLNGTTPVDPDFTKTVFYVESITPIRWGNLNRAWGVVEAGRVGSVPLGGLALGDYSVAGNALVAGAGEEVYLKRITGHSSGLCTVELLYSTGDFNSGVSPGYYGSLFTFPANGHFDLDLSGLQPPGPEKYAYFVQAKAASGTVDLSLLLTATRL